MLIISRRKGQKILIGDDIVLEITELHRSSVKIGIVAPRSYLVLRAEALQLPVNPISTAEDPEDPEDQEP
jgi:carbon storage regulator